jgi:hypothetical protein
MAGRKPDYIVRSLHKQTNKKGIIGAAWVKEQGRISIAINPFIAIPINEDLILTLFPNTEPATDQDLIEVQEPDNVVPWK